MGGYRPLFAVAASAHKAVTRHVAGKFVRLVAALGLDTLGLAAHASWCYIAAADASAQIHGTAYLSVRVRLVVVEGRMSYLSNLHICAPPFTDSHTGKNMHEMTVAVLGALDNKWDKTLNGATSDGARSMTGV